MSETLERWTAAWRGRVDERLAHWLRSSPDDPTGLVEAMRHAVLGGGKRLRPIAALLAAHSVEGEVEEALDAACSVEFVHAYSLVHDDLPCMDDDDLRRGRPTVHKAFGEALAVLAGDALLTLAFEVLAASLPSERARRAAHELARAAGRRGMVAGQALDLAAEGRRLDADEVLALDERKTAALFGAAFRLGGVAVGASEAALEALGTVGRELGVAFQIVDDVLDRRQSSERMGKRTGKDQARGKATLPELWGDEKALRWARRSTEAALEAADRLPKPRLIQELARSMLRRSH